MLSIYFFHLSNHNKYMFTLLYDLVHPPATSPAKFGAPSSQCLLLVSWLPSNFNSQTFNDFAIQIVVSKEKFQKHFNGQTRFCQEAPNFVCKQILVLSKADSNQ